MTVALLLVTSGRTPYLWACTRSVERLAKLQFHYVCVVDTSPEGVSERCLTPVRRLSDRMEIIRMPGGHLRPALEAGWNALAVAQVTHVFHLEEDFVITRKIDFGTFTAIADLPGCAQVLLVRQRWYPKEFEASTMFSFYESVFLLDRGSDHTRLRSLFSFNPSVYRLDRILPIAEGVADGGVFEQELSTAVGKEELWCWVSNATRRLPPVLHIGAVTTNRMRTMSRLPLVGRSFSYAAIHLKRAAVVSARLVRRCIVRRNHRVPRT
jgi:hypothetical protein